MFVFDRAAALCQLILRIHVTRDCENLAARSLILWVGNSYIVSHTRTEAIMSQLELSFGKILSRRGHDRQLLGSTSRTDVLFNSAAQILDPVIDSLDPAFKFLRFASPKRSKIVLRTARPDSSKIKSKQLSASFLIARALNL